MSRVSDVQEFKDLIRYCHHMYSTSSCAFCAMGSCKRNGGEDCYNCLKYIHNFHNHTDHYACDKITYNYILKHGYRYVSEISKAITDIKSSLLYSRPYICILSVGCGPSTELYGAIQALQGRRISYMGIDRNPIWTNIQTFNKERFASTEHFVQYSSDDLFTLMESSAGSVDILILNYFFSDLVKFSPDITDEFIRKLAFYINHDKFKWVIINDIPLFYGAGTGYSCMENLTQQLCPEQKYNISRRHFAEPNAFQPTYGKKLDSGLSVTIDEPEKVYQPFASCGSIQLIIRNNIYIK